MRNILMVVLTIFLVGCGSTEGGGNGATPATPVDNSPHTYIAGYTVMANYGQAHSATLHQVCNFGAADVRDEVTVSSLPAPAGGEQQKVGCSDARNYTFEITNTGAVPLHFNISIDGIYRPEFDRVISPAETYTFQRGF